MTISKRKENAKTVKKARKETFSPAPIQRPVIN